MTVSIKSFYPVNTWNVVEDERRLEDKTTRQLYDNEAKSRVRFKCFLLILAVPIVHTVASVINIAYRILKLVTFSHFWIPEPKYRLFPYTFQERLDDFTTDFTRIRSQPIALLGMELAAIYGLFRPYDGRKLYASIERFQYNHGFHLAPCFQPRRQSMINIG